MSENRRDAERLQILGALPGDATVRQQISVLELSQTGARIEATFPLQINSLHEFRIALGSQSVVVKGRVAHCHIHEIDSDAVVYRAGIEFVDLPAWVGSAIVQFLEAVKAGREG
jgi:hypothetical protein